jgi:hypothetical protein
MIPFYSHYADQKSYLMNFESFSRFFTDFEIFPDILSKPKIMRFFKTLSGFFETTSKQVNGNVPEEKKSNDASSIRRDVIDEHLFVEALALTAFEINYQDPQPTNAEKVSDFNFLIFCTDHSIDGEAQSQPRTSKGAAGDWQVSLCERGQRQQ